MSVKIIIDSNTDFSAETAKELGFLYMPIQVQFDGKEYLDGVDLLPLSFYEKLENSSVMPQTSLINEFRWREAFEDATKDGSEVIAITISSKLSGTYQAALSAAQRFNGRVHVIDSLNATFGEGALALYAIQLKNQGLSAKEIVDNVNEKKKQICVFAVIDTLKYLKKGGRISAASAIIGTALSIKPLVGVIDGEVKVISKAMGRKKGYMMLNTLIKNAGEIDLTMPMGYIWSGTDKTSIEQYVKDTANIFGCENAKLYSLGCSIGTHIGPGAIGFVFFKNNIA